MKIILTISDSKGRNILFVSDSKQVYSLEEAIELANNKVLDNIYTIHRKSGDYLRVNKNRGTSLDHLSMSSHTFLSSMDNINKILSFPNLKSYFDSYQNLLIKQEKTGEDIIRIDGFPRSTKKYIHDKLFYYQQFIIEASTKFSVNKYLLGAILIDEIVRISPFEEIRDRLLVDYLDSNLSIGMGQIKIETARILIKSEYYNPDSNDEKLNIKNISRTSRSYLYKYLIQPKHNIYFSAARIKYLVDIWKKKVVAQFQMGYKGFIQLAIRSGQYKTIGCATIYEGQLLGGNPLIGYEFDFSKESKIVSGYAAYMKTISGYEKVFYMPLDKMQAHATRYSQSYKNKKGRWVDDFDTMGGKTVIKLMLSKFGLLSVSLQKAVIYDQAVVLEDGTIDYTDNQIDIEAGLDEAKAHLKASDTPKIEMP